MYNRISINPEIYHGQACIKRTRIPVYQIVRIDYAATLAEELVTPLEGITKEVG